MSIAATVSAITARMRAAWSATPLCFANGVAHDGNVFAPPQRGAWVYLEVLPGNAIIAGIGGGPGNHTLRQSGIIFAHVFIPINTDTTVAMAHIDAIAAIFQTAMFNGIRCGAASPGGSGSGSEDGKWYRISVSVPFEFDFIG